MFYNILQKRGVLMDNLNIIPEIHHTLYRKTYPGWRIPGRTINDHELVLVTSGKGTITLNKQVFTSSEGMLFHFCPGVSHSLETNDLYPMGFFAIHFDIFSFIPGGIPEKFPCLIKEVSSPQNYAVIKKLFKEINFLRQNRLYGYRLASSSLFGQLLYEIAKGEKTEAQKKSMKKAEEIISFINENLDKKLTLSVLSSEFSLNPSYLSQFFKAETGKSPIEYINSRKTERAKELLIEEKFKIKEIASMLGFSDPYYFSRVFKNTEGVSPDSFLKNFTNNQ